MSENIVEIVQPTNYFLTIETSVESNNNNVTIQLTQPNSINVINNTTVLVSDLPQGYPLSWTTENLPISRVSGLIGTSGINYNNGNISISGIPYDFIPVHDIVAGSGIGISNNSGIFSVAVTGTFGLTGEQVDDRVKDLLKPGSYVNLNYNDTNDSLTISVNGLQPAGNYSLNGHSHIINDIANLQSILDSKQASGNYSVEGHSHNSNDITNFNSSVSGLLPNVQGSGYVVVNFSNNSYKISTSGLQPSGNYSLVGHNHSTSDITNFNSAVSGLLPPPTFSSLTGISGIAVSNSGTNYFVSLSDPSIQLNDITDLSLESRNFLLIPSSNNLKTLINDETGSGSLVFNNSPSFSGIPTVPTASSGTNNEQIANTSFVRTEISNLVNSAPSTLDTLNELAAALGNDSNFSSTIANNLSQKANLSGANFTGSVSAPSGDFNILKQNGVVVSVSGHSHSSNDILDFNSSVSGLLPITNLIGGSYININASGTTFNISTSGLQPSGNYSLQGHSHVVADVSGLQNILDNKQVVGNYSVEGHTHTSNNISDFNSSVSGLLPVTNIIGGTNISISQSGSNFTVNVSGQLGLTSEEVDDRVSSLLASGSGIVLNYDDINNILTIGTSGLQPSGNYSIVGHNHVVSDITDFNSAVSGLVSSGVNTSLAAGSGISLEYYSNTDTLTIATSGVSFVGHKHNANEINDFDSAVKLIKLNDLAAPTGVLNVNSQRIINVATAVSGTDAINKNYIDTLVATTGTKGIASFDSGDFSVTSGVVSIKNSGIDNSQLVYSNIILGSTTMNLGSTYLTLSGVTIDGGSP